MFNGGKWERNITNFSGMPVLIDGFQIKIGIENGLPNFIVFCLKIIEKLM
jgi:hypothetical protein